MGLKSHLKAGCYLFSLLKYCLKLANKLSSLIPHWVQWKYNSNFLNFNQFEFLYKHRHRPYSIHRFGSTVRSHYSWHRCMSRQCWFQFPHQFLRTCQLIISLSLKRLGCSQTNSQGHCNPSIRLDQGWTSLEPKVELISFSYWI